MIPFDLNIKDEYEIKRMAKLIRESKNDCGCTPCKLCLYKLDDTEEYQCTDIAIAVHLYRKGYRKTEEEKCKD